MGFRVLCDMMCLPGMLLGQCLQPMVRQVFCALSLIFSVPKKDMAWLTLGNKTE